MRMARRLEAMGHAKYNGTTRLSGGRPKWNGVVRTDENILLLPLQWKTGRMIFVNSMSDLFHEEVPFEFIEEVFEVMRNTPQHTYQILTKRSERLYNLSKKIVWPNNVWMGVSVESYDFKYRIDNLRVSDAKTKFLSLEPLIGPLGELNLDGINWVIAGGESGPNARPMEPAWVRSIRDQCVLAKVAFHFKQWGGVNKKKTGRMLDGKTWDELPTLVRST
jgi:protein gp37